uniref:MATE family efflux transporter n=1 Tax=Leisingera sp. F5 TaxID=1813816 RepID=UPI000AA0749F
AEALVGGAVGAKERARVRRAAVVTSQWGVGGAVLLGLAFAVGGPWLIDLMSTSEDVRAAGRVFLIWAVAMPVLGIASWMFDGIYIGATWTRDMRWAMLQSVAIYVMALLLLVPAFGNHGLWASLIVLNIARGVTLGLRYPRLEAQVGV